VMARSAGVWCSDRVRNERLEAPEPVGPGTGETGDGERAGAPELLAVQHHPLDRAGELPRLVMGVEVVGRDEHPEVPVLGGLEEPRKVLDRVVFLEAVAEQIPGDAFLTQDIVLRVDNDKGRVFSVDDHRVVCQSGLPGLALRWTLPLAACQVP